MDVALEAWRGIAVPAGTPKAGDRDAGGRDTQDRGKPRVCAGEREARRDARVHAGGAVRRAHRARGRHARAAHAGHRPEEIAWPNDAARPGRRRESAAAARRLRRVVAGPRPGRGREAARAAGGSQPRRRKWARWSAASACRRSRETRTGTSPSCARTTATASASTRSNTTPPTTRSWRARSARACTRSRGSAARGGFGARAALYLSLEPARAGHACPVTMTFAVDPGARHDDPHLASQWKPKVLADAYDPRPVAARATRRGATIGMAMTEKQGGSDLRAVHDARRRRPAAAHGGSRATNGSARRR